MAETLSQRRVLANQDKKAEHKLADDIEAETINHEYLPILGFGNKKHFELARSGLDWHISWLTSPNV